MREGPSKVFTRKVLNNQMNRMISGPPYLLQFLHFVLINHPSGRDGGYLLAWTPLSPKVGLTGAISKCQTCQQQSNADPQLSTTAEEEQPDTW